VRACTCRYYYVTYDLNQIRQLTALFCT